MQRTGSTKTLIGRIAFLALFATLFALAFSVRGDAPGLTFATNGVDLKIDSKAYYNGASVPASTWSLKNLVPSADHFFDFSDIKPGDSGHDLISLHVNNTDSWLCLDFSNLMQQENGINEPESLIDSTTGSAQGELAAGTEFFGWVDDGDGKFEHGERVLFGTTTRSALTVLNNASYAIGDTRNGNSCRVNQSKYVGIAWCAGHMTVNLTTGAISCDGSTLGNAAQTDSFSVDVSITAMPAGDHSKFVCTSAVVPPPPPHSGSISGTVYEDSNGNSKKDANETRLSGWTIKLYKGAGWNNYFASALSDASGGYNFANLADGTYSIEEIIKSGWDQVTSDYKSVTISNGAALTGKDFGNLPLKNKKK